MNLVVCETCFAIVYHLRCLLPEEKPCYSRRPHRDAKTLCGSLVAWDTELPLGNETCRVCIEKRDRMNKKIEVLDHGFVELVDHMGDDQAIVDAARVSIAGENVRPTSENRGLIRYLMRHRHTTPFEMVEFKFRAKLPIVVARQWVRHRTASINEMSGRYSEMPEEFYVPSPENIKVQASNNKQGRGDEVVSDADDICIDMRAEGVSAFKEYRRYLDDGVARELARINLPLSTYTQWIWKIDLHNLFHFLALRMDKKHPQYEIRVYADAMAALIKPIVPLAWAAFVDFRLEAMILSRDEILALQKALALRGSHDFPTQREADEFAVKLHMLMEE